MSESVLLSFKNTKRGKDKKGRDTLVLYMNPEQVAALVAQIQANTNSERGVKIALHTEEKEAPWGMATSTFGFVNAIDPPGAGYSKGAPAKPYYNKKPVTATASTTKARAAQTLNTEID